MKKLLAIATPSMLLIAFLFSFVPAKKTERNGKTLAEHINPIQFPQPEPTEPLFSDVSKKRLEQAIQKYFDNAVKRNQIVGASVAVVKCDSIIYAGGFGNRNASLKDTVNANTVFRIGSVSKGFAGILTGIHVQDGDIAWQDKIIDHIPNFKLANKTQTNKVTLSHVLSHTSGLPYHSFTNLVEDGLTLTTIAGRFNEVLPLQEPGNFYNYQNAIFALSGEIIERVTGKPLKEVIQDRIFDPLQMETASASYEALEKSENVAMPHQRVRRGWRPMRINKKYYNAVAAGGVNASAVDMGKWMKFLLGNNPDVLLPSTMKDVFNPMVQVGGRRNYYQRWPGYKASFYALGWRIHEFKDAESGDVNKVIHHGGGVNNYRSEIAIYPNEDIGICVLFNSPNKMAKDCIPKIHEIIKEVMQLESQDNEYMAESLVAL
ncbi:serine hydrolase domain-containing protein [Aquimarina gracilis]|uniref:Serine hydrolase domain-containing protein n=1 Tax=Aquimarina gracilis TaxID=874422 RepID=A0ABU5ZRG5_9FLAO|nr:serine hydrolase domain-containing protein [Aquimarina gracilis]MEB3344238.1 serine hydrolase domain-containing protein [Aquimarina gracilis]